MTSRAAGRLVALEGVDGCGKSTQAARLAQVLDALLTHEPGATALGRALRTLLLDPSVASAPGPRTEALLMAADRAQHVDEVVRPALDAGRWVVTDRYSGSTLAYQGWGRRLPVEALREVVGFASGGVEADLSVLVDVPLEVARRRLAGARPDRLESLDPGFHGRVREGYLELARGEPDRWVVVDGTGSVDDVAKAVESAVRERVGAP